MQQLLISSFGSSDPGKQREINEDSFLIDSKKYLYLVADGMGGHSAGEVASKMACTSFSEHFSDTADNIGEHMIDCMKKVNAVVYSKAASEINLHGMGTTMVACFCTGDTAHICHAGDSRAYLFRNEELHQLTEDHSAVALMLRQGYITREEAEDHPMKNRITKAVGTMPDIVPDYTSCPLKKNDLLLICSDGLTNMVKEPDIKEILRLKSSIEERVLLLIQTANNNGGLDNITAVLVEAK
jgi:serine/threonine protein phosphatase PrpC